MARISIIAAKDDESRVSDSAQCKLLIRQLKEQGNEVDTSWGFLGGATRAVEQQRLTRADMFVVFSSSDLLAEDTYSSTYRPAVLKAGQRGNVVMVNLRACLIDYAPEGEFPLIPQKPINKEADWTSVNRTVLEKVAKLNLPPAVSGGLSGQFLSQTLPSPMPPSSVAPRHVPSQPVTPQNTASIASPQFSNQESTIEEPGSSLYHLLKRLGVDVHVNKQAELRELTDPADIQELIESTDRLFSRHTGVPLEDTTKIKAALTLLLKPVEELTFEDKLKLLEDGQFHRLDDDSDIAIINSYNGFVFDSKDIFDPIQTKLYYDSTDTDSFRSNLEQQGYTCVGFEGAKLMIATKKTTSPVATASQYSTTTTNPVTPNRANTTTSPASIELSDGERIDEREKTPVYIVCSKKDKTRANDVCTNFYHPRRAGHSIHLFIINGSRNSVEHFVNNTSVGIVDMDRLSAILSQSGAFIVPLISPNLMSTDRITETIVPTGNNRIASILLQPTELTDTDFKKLQYLDTRNGAVELTDIIYGKEVSGTRGERRGGLVSSLMAMEATRLKKLNP